MFKKAFFLLISLLFLMVLGADQSFSQSSTEMESKPVIKIGKIQFQIRNVGSTSLKIQMLEIQVEVINRSKTLAAESGSVKIVVIPKEIIPPEGISDTGFSQSSEEFSIDSPIAPLTSRMVMIGYSFDKKPISVTFEVQINPPDGEKKTVTWEDHVE